MEEFLCGKCNYEANCDEMLKVCPRCSHDARVLVIDGAKKGSSAYQILELMQEAQKRVLDLLDIISNPLGSNSEVNKKDYGEVYIFARHLQSNSKRLVERVEDSMYATKDNDAIEGEMDLEDIYAMCIMSMNRLERIARAVSKHLPDEEG